MPPLSTWIKEEEEDEQSHGSCLNLDTIMVSSLQRTAAPGKSSSSGLCKQGAPKHAKEVLSTQTAEDEEHEVEVEIKVEVKAEEKVKSVRKRKNNGSNTALMRLMQVGTDNGATSS